MSTYLFPEIESDPNALAQDSFDYLEDKIEGFVPAEGNLDTIMIEAKARMAAEVRDLASMVPTAIYRHYGASVIGMPPIEATAATVSSTWTMEDDSGYTIPAGTLVGIRKTGDEIFAFEVTTEVVVAPGDTVTEAGEVPLQAVDPGGDASGLSGTPELIDGLVYVASIALVGITTGGVDGEEDEAYLDRLVAKMRLLAPRPILPDDFAVMARDIAGVYRATAIDGYDPSDESYDNERMVAVAVIDETGEPVSAGVKNAVDAYLQSEREFSFVVNVIDPTYTTLDVTFTAKALTGFDVASVETAAELAVTEYLSPATWGALPPMGDVGTGLPWVNQTTVRYGELWGVIDRVEGVDYVQTLSVEGGVIDIDLDGPAPLPRPGIIAGTVS